MERARILALLLTGFPYPPQDDPSSRGTKPLPPPSFENVPYGPHERNVLDLWQAKASQPTPLVIFIHGGGFRKGDKRDKLSPGLVENCMKAGVSVASLNYRFSQHAIYPGPMMDCARAVQFLRHKAGEWNLDPSHFSATGGSAGGGISLWLGFHDDLADLDSPDPVARESTRLSCMFVSNAQSSYDPRFIKQHIPGNAYKHSALVDLFGLKPGEIDAPPADKVKLFEDASAINHLTADDPPVYAGYSYEDALTPDLNAGTGIHHITFGKLLKEKMDALKIECWVQGRTGPRLAINSSEFYLKHLGVRR